MRYVLVDQTGAPRDYFSSRDAAREAVLALEDEAPGTAQSVYVMAYGDDGQPAGNPESGDELLSRRELDWSGAMAGAVAAAAIVGDATVISGASSTVQTSRQVPTRQFAGASR